MQTNTVSPAWAQFVPLIIVVAVLAIRLVRPQRISVTRMWVSPILLCAITAWAIYASQIMNPAPPLEIALGLVVGAAAGVPFGILRGIHTDVRPTNRPGVMYLGSSWATIAIWVVAFGVRLTARTLMPHRGSLASIVGDGALAFAIAFIATSYIAIYRKYEKELAGQIATPQAPSEPH
ncbi:MAG: DUF1453 family protein [Candidatus Eremiobacteraeota bacterium]|nr:DUF1453 family protein [Candidatus Eremiobacteraeota bacterium]